MEGKVSLTVPIDITDEQLVNVLKEVLPGIIVRLPSTSPLHQRMVPELAEGIVFMARRCARSPHLRDIAYRLQAKGPTPEQCQIFESAVKELMELRFGEVKENRHHRPMYQIVMGKIWARLEQAVGGKTWEEEEASLPPASGPGVRG